LPTVGKETGLVNEQDLCFGHYEFVRHRSAPLHIRVGFAWSCPYMDHFTMTAAHCIDVDSLDSDSAFARLSSALPRSVVRPVLRTAFGAVSAGGDEQALHGSPATAPCVEQR
jgi:hypothetical protein